MVVIFFYRARAFGPCIPLHSSSHLRHLQPAGYRVCTSISTFVQPCEGHGFPSVSCDCSDLQVSMLSGSRSKSLFRGSVPANDALDPSCKGLDESDQDGDWLCRGSRDLLRIQVSCARIQFDAFRALGCVVKVLAFVVFLRMLRGLRAECIGAVGSGGRSC